MDNITALKGDYEFLAMTYIYPITVDGITYTNAEAAFWSQRIKDKKARNKLSRLSAMKARAKALQAEPIDDWDETKDDILKRILEIKFKDESLRKKLLSTGDAMILNNNTYRDEYYGIYNGKGKNILGKMLMELRSSLN